MGHELIRTPPDREIQNGKLFLSVLHSNADMQNNKVYWLDKDTMRLVDKNSWSIFDLSKALSWDPTTIFNLFPEGKSFNNAVLYRDHAPNENDIYLSENSIHLTTLRPIIEQKVFDFCSFRSDAVQLLFRPLKDKNGSFDSLFTVGDPIFYPYSELPAKVPPIFHQTGPPH